MIALSAIQYTAAPGNCAEVVAFIGPQPKCTTCGGSGEFETEYGPRGCGPCNSRLIAVARAGETQFADWGDWIVRVELGGDVQFVVVPGWVFRALLIDPPASMHSAARPRFPSWTANDLPSVVADHVKSVAGWAGPISPIAEAMETLSRTRGDHWRHIASSEAFEKVAELLRIFGDGLSRAVAQGIVERAALVRRHG